MVLTGHVERFLGRVQVTGMGSFIADGWQVVARYPAANMQSGSGHYAFLIHGLVGETQTLSGTVVWTLMEVAVAEWVGGGIGRIARTHIFHAPCRDARLGTPGMGIPYSFVFVLDNTIRQPNMRVDPHFGSTWPANTDLVVIARGFRNQDPPSVNVRFVVADQWIMHWDLQRVPTSHVQVLDHFPMPRQTLPPAVSPPAIFKTWGFPSPSVAENWLFFSSINYAPNSAQGAPRFQVLYNETGQPQYPVIGVGRMGYSARGAPYFGEAQNAHHHMAWRQIWKMPSLPFDLALLGHDQQNDPPPAARTELIHWRLFAIRLEHGVSCSNPDHQAIYTPQPIGRPPGTEAPWLWERSGNVLQSSLVALFQASPLFLHPQTGTHEAFLLDEARTSHVSPNLYAQTDGSLGEGQHSIVVSRRLRNLQDFRWRFYMWHLPAQTLPSVDCVDVAGIEWGFETAPSNVPGVAPQPIDPVVLIPGREAFQVQYLADPPHDIYDVDGWDEEPTDHVRRLVSDSGYMRTWPGPVAVRSVVRCRRTGLTRPQRDELLNWLRTHLTFRVAPPRSTTKQAVAILERPRGVDHGNVFGVELTIGLLINLGGGGP